MKRPCFKTSCQATKGYKLVKCCNEDDPMDPMYSPPRGTAGVATIWPLALDHAIDALPDGSNRVLVHQLATSNGNITIFNTYMPTEGTHNKDADYGSLLDEVHETIMKYGQVWKRQHHLMGR